MSTHKKIDDLAVNNGDYNYEKYQKELSGFGWKPISELRLIDEDITLFRYPRKYLEEKGCYQELLEHDKHKWIVVREPIGVAEEDGVVYFDENLSGPFHSEKKEFVTQFGAFIQHKGFFIAIDDPEHPIEDEPYGSDALMHIPDGVHELKKEGKAFIGHYYDVFDLGEYTYAISNHLHMGGGYFSIERLEKGFIQKRIYRNADTWNSDDIEKELASYKTADEQWNNFIDYAFSNSYQFRYIGCFNNERGCVLVISGQKYLLIDEYDYHNSSAKTVLIQIFTDGRIGLYAEWDMITNSVAAIGDYAYFGHNRMVTRLDIHTGETTFWTNKSAEEVALMRKIENDSMGKLIMDLLKEDNFLVVALTLAFIPLEQLIFVFSAFPSDKQFDVIYCLAKMYAIDSEALEEAKAILRSDYPFIIEDNITREGIDYVAEILNEVNLKKDLNTEKDILSRIKSADPGLIYEIRRKSITIGDLQLLDDDSIKQVLNDLSDEDIVFSLKGSHRKEQDIVYGDLPEVRAQAIMELESTHVFDSNEVEKAEARQRLIKAVKKYGYDEIIVTKWNREHLGEVLTEDYKSFIETVKNELSDVYTENDHPGRDVCDYLKWIRRQIADKNGIEFESAECHNTKPCTGTCPVCEAENRFLEEQLRKKAERGEDVDFVGGSCTTEEFLNSKGELSDMLDEKRSNFPDMYRIKPKKTEEIRFLGAVHEEIYRVSGRTIDPFIIHRLKAEPPEKMAKILANLEPYQAALILPIFDRDKQAELICHIAVMDRDDLNDLKKESRGTDPYNEPIQPESLDIAVSVLNNVDENTKEGILRELEGKAPELANEIRRMIIESSGVDRV